MARPVEATEHGRTADVADERAEDSDSCRHRRKPDAHRTVRIGRATMVGMGSHGADSCEDLVADCRVRMAADLFTHTRDPVVIAALNAGPKRRRTLRIGIVGTATRPHRR